jgi:exodeoxyribonuclease VII large subunit
LSTIPSIKLSELTSQIQQVIDGAFGHKTFWIIADITNYTYKPQSNYHYFELVEKDKTAAKILAKVAGRAWGNASLNISNFEKATGQKFKNDINVLIQVSVQYNPSFGLQLNLLDIDTNFTLGLFEQQRKETLERLLRENQAFIKRAGEGYITRNSELALNQVIQRIAVISSDTSAGFQDFKHTLEHNPFDYKFYIDDYFALVQGDGNAKQFLARVIEVFESQKPYDALVIIRGGGAQTDFLIFDNYELNRAIAKFPIPVITGIGHQKNETIADLMAHTSTKTPTKAAEFIIAHNRAFEDNLIGTQKMILIKTYQMINHHKDRLVRLNQITINKGLEPHIGSFTQQLSFVYVKDLAAVLVKALFSPLVSKQYNVSDGNIYNRYALADFIKKALQKKTFKFHLPVPIVGAMATLMDVFYAKSRNTPALNKEKMAELTAINWACNIDHVKADLGYEPEYDLEKGLNETVSWYKSNNWL